VQGLDLRLVRYFVAVAEELHFGRAAARLHIAQPSLSHQVRRLEQQLGVTLLERTSRRVALTPAGETFLTEGRRLLNDARRAVRVTRAAAEGQLVVGFSGSAAGSLFAEVLRVFADERPEVRVSIRELLLDRVDDIVDGRVDLAFTRLLPGQQELDVEVLAREARVVALPVTHRLAGRGSICFRDLGDDRFITNPVARDAGPPARWFREQQRHGLPGRVAEEAASIEEILTLVAAGRGVCLVPESVAQRYPHADVRYVPVVDAEPAVVSVASARETSRPVVEAFRQVARKVALRRSGDAEEAPACSVW
jgi:DNA-binding transcriptional LysR family regulator